MRRNGRKPYQRRKNNNERNNHLEGQGDFVSRLITPIAHIVTPFIPLIRPLTKSP